MLVRKSWPCRSGCGWWRPPLVCWSAPLCQILLLVLGCRLAGPSRKGPSRTSASLLAVAVTLLQDFYCTLSQPCREFQPHLANQCKVRLIPVSSPATALIFSSFYQSCTARLFCSTLLDSPTLHIRLPSQVHLLLPSSAVHSMYPPGTPTS